MAITERQFMSFENDTVIMYMSIDDRNSTNETRWRVLTFRMDNQTEWPYYMYVEDPATPGVRYPDGDPNVEGWQPDPVLSHSEKSWSVPAQYQTANPWEFTWGGGGLRATARGASAIEYVASGKELEEAFHNGTLPIRF